MRTFRTVALSSMVILSVASASFANITWNLTYDSSIPPAQLAAVTTATNYATGVLSNLYADDIKLNVTIKAANLGAADDTIGMSNWPLTGTYTYAQTKTLLKNDITTPNDQLAVDNLADPTTAGKFWLTRAQGKALKEIVKDDATNDGTFTFNTNTPYAMDPNNRAVTGKYDFVGVELHEITEIMGRNAGLNTTVGTTANSYYPFDLFRYKGGAQDVTSGTAGVMFSLQSGATTSPNPTKSFNGNAGDKGDWAAGSDDSFNANSNKGVVNNFSDVDVVAMDVIGYDQVPEPGSLALLGIGSISVLRRRRRD